jgi:hypothetical protein
MVLEQGGPMTEDRDAPIRFTDEEAAFLRHVRFGELPARARPEELVELVETDPARPDPDPAVPPHGWEWTG